MKLKEREIRTGPTTTRNWKGFFSTSEWQAAGLTKFRIVLHTNDIGNTAKH
jgi:hypothetical protein